LNIIYKYIKMIFHFLKSICIVFGISVLLILFLEGISNIILKNYNAQEYNHNKAHDPKDILWLDDYKKEYNSSSITEWEPYIYFRRKPFVGKYININKNGNRETKQWNIKRKDTDKVFNIFMFGGSVLWGDGARDDHTIPSLVSKVLSEHGINVNITNFGEGGYVNTQEVIYLLLQLQKNNIPDLVVFFDGVNDVFSVLQNGKAGLPQNEFNRKAEFNTATSPKKLLNLYLVKIMSKSATVNLFNIGSSKFFNFKSPYFDFKLNRNEFHKGALDVINIYFSNMKIVNDSSCGRFIPMFYWQPVLHDKKILTEYEKRHYYDNKEFNEVYALTKDIIKSKAALFNGYHFYNITDIFETTTKPIYIDFCHLNEAGNEIIANKIAGDILKLIQNKSKFNSESSQDNTHKAG
jgi:lysophospholipase L1-like esterase